MKLENFEKEMQTLLDLHSKEKKPHTKCVLFSDTKVYYHLFEWGLISHTTYFKEENTLGFVYIRDIYVKKDYRKTKRGFNMMLWLLKQCIENDVKIVEVEPIEESVNFFIKLGFKDILNKDVRRMRLNLEL